MSDEGALTIKINDREYSFAPPFTNRELHTIKRIAGVRSAEIQQAYEAGDNDLLICLALIAVQRAGAARPTLDELWDMPVGAISVVVPDEDPTPAAVAATPPSGDAGSQGMTLPQGGVPSTASSST